MGKTKKISLERWIGLVFLVIITLIIDVFLFFWEGLKNHNIFPGS